MLNVCLQYALHTIQGHKLQKLSAEVSSSLSLGTPSYAPVVDFLQSAGQGQMVAQVRQLHMPHVLMYITHLWCIVYISAGT